MKVKLMPTGIKGQSGFSLVELMVVVAIIGILAALAVPRFQKFQAKAKQGEAKNNLSHIYTLEQSYFGDNDQYVALTSCGYASACSSTNSPLGFVTDGKTRYNYKTNSASTSGFVADAAAGSATIISNDCTTADEWTMDQNKALANVYNCAAGKAGVL